MKIAVGSANPVKVAAVRNVAGKVWPRVEVEGVDVDSGVAVQPRTDEEAIKGATNRARSAMEKLSADMGVGIEATATENSFGMFTGAWSVVVNRAGEVGLGSGGRLLLPEKVAEQIRAGKELGPVMDELVKGENTKQKHGASGILTNNLVSRTESLEKAVVYSFARFLTPHFYEEKTGASQHKV